MPITDQQRLDAYTGQGGYGTGAYLVRHVRETDDKYLRRQQLARYWNYPRTVVDAYRGTLFARPALRQGTAKPWETLQNAADGRRGRIDDVMRRATLLSMLLGTVYLIVDRPAGTSRTRADDLARAPYIVLRRPETVESLTLDDLGDIERVVFAEPDPARPGKSRYRGFDRLRWWVSADAEGTEILKDESGAPREGEHKLGEVPVVRLHSTELIEVTDARAAPWAEGVVTGSDDLYNLYSELRDLLRSQTFAILTLPFGESSEIDRLREQGLTIGMENALPYAAGATGGAAPGYIAPPAEPMTAYRDAVVDCVARIFQAANLDFLGANNLSGVALDLKRQAANDSLALLAQQVEEVEIACGRLACLWMGVTPGDDLRVVYPRQFAVEDLSRRLGEDMDALGMQLGATAERLIRARTARRVLGDSASPAEYEAIDRDLTDGADPYGDRLAQTPQQTGP